MVSKQVNSKDIQYISYINTDETVKDKNFILVTHTRKLQNHIKRLVHVVED